MASTSNEILDLVTEVEEPFITGTVGGLGSVRDRMKMISDIVFTRYNYAADLSPLLTQPIAVDADTLRSYKEQAKASLMDDYRLHLEPVGDLKREETAIDKVELMEAHSLMKLDPHGYTRDAIRHYAAVGLFFAGWLEMADYIAPEQAKGETNKDYAKRVETYRKAWFQWKFSVRNPLTVAFTEHEREVTTAVMRFRLPIIDVLERYAGDYNVRKDNPEHALTIFNEHFGFLRADEAQSKEYGEGDLFRNDIEVCVADTGTSICHYVDYEPTEPNKRLLTKKGQGRYKGLGKTDYDNPFGQVSLILAEGVYNWYEPLAFRREPLMMALIRIEHGKARLKSHWASRAATPPMVVEKLPPEARGETQEGNLPATMLVDAKGKPLITRTYGEIYELEQKVEAQLEKLFGIFDQEVQIVSPRGLLFDADPGSDIPATTVLADIDERNRLTASAKTSASNVWMRVLDMIKHSRRTVLNNHRTVGEKKQQSDWGMAFTTTGQEWSVKGRAIKRGEHVEVTPQDLDTEFVRTIEPFDNRESSTAARIDVAEKRWAAGTILWDERIEMHGVSNVSEFNREKTEEQLYQLEVMGELMKTRMAVAQFTALINDTTIEEVLGGLPEEIMPQVVGAANPQGMDPGMGGLQMHSPSTQSAGGAPVGAEGFA